MRRAIRIRFGNGRTLLIRVSARSAAEAEDIARMVGTTLTRRATTLGRAIRRALTS